MVFIVFIYVYLYLSEIVIIARGENTYLSWEAKRLSLFAVNTGCWKVPIWSIHISVKDISNEFLLDALQALSHTLLLD